MRPLIGILITATIASVTHSFPFTTTISDFIDLGYSINEDTIYFPGGKDFHLSKDRAGSTKGYWYASFSFCMGEHGGTHVDAPFHFHEDGWTLDKIPNSHLIDVPAVVINVSEEVFKLENPSDFVLDVSHLIDHESKNGRIPPGALVFVNTGWARYWPDKIKYLGWDNSSVSAGNEFKLGYPGLSLNAAKWLANERSIVGLGLDTASMDPGTSKDYSVHRFFSSKQIYGIENVANLHLLPPNCRMIRAFVLPLKIIGGTGAPTRILAYCVQTS